MNNFYSVHTNLIHLQAKERGTVSPVKFRIRQGVKETRCVHNTDTMCFGTGSALCCIERREDVEGREVG